MGITRLGNVTGLDHVGIPVAVAIRPNSRSVSVSQGKGLTLTQALASALMEAVEEFHGENLSSLCRTQCFQNLSAQACVVDYTGLCRTVKLLPEDLQIPWIEGFDLLSCENCWVPAEVVELDFTMPAKPGTGYFLAGSNGLASGNHLLEAISSAICELVERDAAAIWDAQILDQRVSRHLDLTSVHDADCRRLLQAYGRADMAVRAWNVTSDIGIPTFVCDIFPEFEDPCADLPRFRGAGCHPNRAIALARALTEAAQIRLTHIAGIRDDLPASEYMKSPSEKIGAALLDFLSSRSQHCAFQEASSFETDDLAAEIRWELLQLQQAGMNQVIVVDLTRPEYGIPVVRVIIPGLEGDPSHPDYCPGRRARAARTSTACTP